MKIRNFLSTVLDSSSSDSSDSGDDSSSGAVRVLSAALLLTTLGAGVLWASLHRTHDQAAAMEPLARRAQLRDALIGQVVPTEAKLHPAVPDGSASNRPGAEGAVRAAGEGPDPMGARNEDPAGPTEALLPDGEAGLVWIVDPARCVGCLEAAAEWRRAARTLGPRAVLVLHGVRSERARFLVREVGLPGRVLADPAGRVMSAFEMDDPPGTLVLTTDRGGEVVTAAVRDEYRSCSWSPLRRALRLMSSGGRVT